MRKEWARRERGHETALLSDGSQRGRREPLAGGQFGDLTVTIITACDWIPPSSQSNLSSQFKKRTASNITRICVESHQKEGELGRTTKVVEGLETKLKKTTMKAFAW